MELRVGTSGYSYSEWKGTFYPEDLKPADMLAYYAARLPSVEINNTFYRMPRRSVLETWAAQVPDTFRFAVKASQRITHIKRLKDVAEECDFLFGNLGALGARMGVVLFQLPPNFKKDMSRLEAFLGFLPPGLRVAFEFRHASWHDEDVFALLRSRGLALCAADTDGDDEGVPLVATGSYAYLRLRREDYGDEELASWVRRVSEPGFAEAFVYFKHEEAGVGPRLAGRFLSLAGERP